MRKALFLMFGNVDVDFSFYRKLALEGPFDVEAWIDARLEAYNGFIERLIDDSTPDDGFSTVTILAPQPSPVDDETFFAIMPAHTKVVEADFRAAGQHSDLSHTARNRRTVHFNDRLQAGLLPHPLVKLYRIDQDMLDGEGQMIARFYPDQRDEHHAKAGETRQLWFKRMMVDIPTLRFLIA